MKLELVRGCVCDSLNADNVEISYMTDEQKLEVLNKIKSFLTIEHVITLTQWFIEEFYTNYECSEKPCEQCGDYIEEFSIEL